MKLPLFARVFAPLGAICFGISALVAGCAPAGEQETEAVVTTVDVRAEIAAASEGFVAAFNAGDGAGVAANYTVDAVLYPPNGEPVSGGAAALTEFWQSVIDLGIERAILETVEAEGMGDTAVEVGRFTLLDAAGGTIDRGSYMVIWKRTEAGWKLHRDIWNSDLAPAP